MKILHVVPFFNEDLVGGTERFVYNISKFQQGMGHEVRILTGSYSKSSQIEKNIIIERYRNLTQIAGFNPFVIINPLSPSIRWADIVHIHSPLYFISIQTSLICSILKKKYVIHIHGGLGKPPSNINNFLTKIKPLFDKTVVKFQLKNSSKVITVSNEDRSYIINTLNIESKKIKFIQNGISKSFLKGNNLKIEKINGKFNIVFLGDLEPWKGVEDLLIALKSMNKQISRHINLQIYGDGDSKPKLIEFARSIEVKIKFEGWLPHKEVPRVLQQADLFVHTGRWEGMPTTVIEAAASNTPIIASDAGETKNFIKHKESGLLYRSSDPDDLKSKLDFAINNMEFMQEMAEVAQSRVKNNYTFNKVANIINRLYKEIILE